MPIQEILRKARMRKEEGSITERRKKGKLQEPALPPSIRVVTPDLQANGSGSTLTIVPGQKTWQWKSTRPGNTQSPFASKTEAASERRIFSSTREICPPLIPI